MIFSKQPRRGATRVHPLMSDPMVVGPSFAAAFTWGYVAVGVGTAVGGYLSRPKAPKAAEAKTINPQNGQAAAISGDAAASDGIEALLARSNSFTQDQANSLTEKAMPGYSAIASKFMKQADGLLTNPYQLDGDVAKNIERLAAERGISTGVRGEAADYSLLRDFGLNSIDQGGKRISQAQSILQTIGSLSPRVNPMSPMSLYITPSQQLAADTGNNSFQFNAAQSQNNADAAAANANSSMWGGIVSNIGGLAGSYLSTKAGAAKTGANTPAQPQHVDENWSFNT